MRYAGESRHHDSQDRLVLETSRVSSTDVNTALVHVLDTAMAWHTTNSNSLREGLDEISSSKAKNRDPKNLPRVHVLEVMLRPTLNVSADKFCSKCAET